MQGRIADALTAVLVLVSAITLAVGGVGIMNIMLANVRCTHPRNWHSQGTGRDLPRDQASVPCRGSDHFAGGGLVGVLVGLTVPLSIRFFTDYALPISGLVDFRSRSPPRPCVGVIFGTVPATRAAQMDPVDALKYE